jgi:hypothetical protein
VKRSLLKKDLEGPLIAVLFPFSFFLFRVGPRLSHQTHQFSHFCIRWRPRDLHTRILGEAASKEPGALAPVSLQMKIDGYTYLGPNWGR